jgi:hypothetical protein
MSTPAFQLNARSIYAQVADLSSKLEMQVKQNKKMRKQIKTQKKYFKAHRKEYKSIVMQHARDMDWIYSDLILRIDTQQQEIEDRLQPIDDTCDYQESQAYQIDPTQQVHHSYPTEHPHRPISHHLIGSATTAARSHPSMTHRLFGSTSTTTSTHNDGSDLSSVCDEDQSEEEENDQESIVVSDEDEDEEEDEEEDEDEDEDEDEEEDYEIDIE